MKLNFFYSLFLSAMPVLFSSCKKNFAPEMEESSNLYSFSEKHLETLEPGFSRAFSINNSGAIAGSAINEEGKIVVFALNNNKLWYSDEEVRTN